MCQRQSAFGLSAEGLFSVIFQKKKPYWGMGGKLERKVLIPPGWECC